MEEGTQAQTVEQQQTAPETQVAATEIKPAEQAPANTPETTSFETALGGKAGETANGNTNSSQEGAQKAAEVVEYNFADTVKNYDSFDFSQEDSAQFVGLIKDMNLSNEQANAVLKHGMDWGNRIVQQIQTQLDDMVQGWGETAKQQLGANYDSTLRKAGSALEVVEKYVPNLRQALNETGAGNRVEIINALAFFADKIASDPGMVAGAQTSGKPADAYDARYPNTDWSKYK